ncbi:hypothetical protein ENBRE01_2060 [Enteropsectra breve]|nr:hypothetical protein ENBRE01_2060 [Enteropsectra breve]
MHARKLALELEIPQFKGTTSWCYRFMKRKNLVIRSVTSVGQKIPQDWESKVENFRAYLANKCIGLQLEQIGNMDEVPVRLDISETRIVDTKGVKQVRLVTNGCEK